MTSTSASDIDLLAILQDRFGHETFRPGQERVIRALLRGRDVMAVQPTGAGKSLVFQLAAQLLPGVTLVVSPLIALMKDQAESVEEHGLGVSVVNSMQSEGQSEEAMLKVEREEAKLLYVTPERFQDGEFMEQVGDMEVSLLVVDEAHCVSEWGYDFRPAYLALGHAAEQLGRPALLALTATATPWVRRDIIDRLGLRQPEIVVHSVDRPNLFFEVRRVEEEEEDHRVLHRLLTETPEEYPAELAEQLAQAMQGSGIIYTGTTRAAQETAEWLRDWGITAEYYHGQRKKADRDRVQEAFMAGELRVITATNAFGLGVDKPDVRFVIHRDIPASVEAYYQEAGRAGRDGEPARCTIIYRPADLGRAAFLSGSGQVSLEEVRRARATLVGKQALTRAELAKAAELSRGKLPRVLELLKREGILEEDEERLSMRVPDFDPEQVSLEGEESRRAYERSRLQMMRSYAEMWDCRRRYILNYFGQEMEPERCGRCDNDVLGRSSPAGEEQAEPSPFPKGQRVVHTHWGEGQVIGVEGDTLTVFFTTEGEKKLAADLVSKEGLLRPLGGPGRNAAPEGEAETQLALGDRVMHTEYGEGEIQRVTEDLLTVLFRKAGYKTLAREAVDEGLLKKFVE